MSARFTLESDFVDSYINSFLISNYKNENLGSVLDAKVYERCINLNSSVLKTANCTSRGEKVQQYIARFGEEFTKLKETAIGSCSTQILQAHNLFYALNQNSHNQNSYNQNLSIEFHNDKVNALKSCIDSNLN